MSDLDPHLQKLARDVWQAVLAGRWQVVGFALTAWHEAFEVSQGHPARPFEWHEYCR